MSFHLHLFRQHSRISMEQSNKDLEEKFAALHTIKLLYIVKGLVWQLHTRGWHFSRGLVWMHCALTNVEGYTPGRTSSRGYVTKWELFSKQYERVELQSQQHNHFTIGQYTLEGNRIITRKKYVEKIKISVSFLTYKVE